MGCGESSIAPDDNRLEQKIDQLATQLQSIQYKVAKENRDTKSSGRTPNFPPSLPLPPIHMDHDANGLKLELALKEDSKSLSLVARGPKLVCTLGPATWDQIGTFMRAGVDMIRINFSHATHALAGKHIGQIISERESLLKEEGRHVAILADLQGPKFRTGYLEDHKKMEVEDGEEIRLISGEVQEFGGVTDKGKVITTGTKHAHICVYNLQPGQRVLLADGAVELIVKQRVSKDELILTVIHGGAIGEKKGINVPDMSVPMPALTEKDRKDAVFAISQNVDYLALSFVQRAQDVVELRDLIEESIEPEQVAPKIIAKIEKPQALEVIDEIIAVVDGIMVARGDLGVECHLQKVPTFQKMLIRKANAAKKLVITATQMLESMTESAAPTRAEVSDVANAVCDGTDAVMLSGESAVGQFPILAVKMMASICLEAQQLANKMSPPLSLPPVPTFRYSLAHSAVAAANVIGAKSIIMLCMSFDLALYLSKLRPSCPIVVVTFSEKIAHFLAPCYGVHVLELPEPAPSMKSSDFLVQIETAILDKKWISIHDPVVFMAHRSPWPSLANSTKLHRLGDWRTRTEAVNNWKATIEFATQKKYDKPHLRLPLAFSP